MSTVEETLRQLEETLLRPEVRRDPAAVESLLAEEFREVATTGRVYNRPDVVEALASDAAAERSISEFQALLVQAGVALVIYRAMKRDASGTATSVSLRSSIWVYRNERWQVLFHQGTPAPA